MRVGLLSSNGLKICNFSKVDTEIFVKDSKFGSCKFTIPKKENLPLTFLNIQLGLLTTNSFKSSEMELNFLLFSKANFP